MGVKLSKKEIQENKKNGIADILDRIFIDVINSNDFKLFKRGTSYDKCNEILGITNELLMRNFNMNELEVIQKRIENGVEKTKTVYEPIIYTNSERLKNEKNKKYICEAIAKFYVKIFNLFSSILKTINPIYIYKNRDGEESKISILNKTQDIIQRKGSLHIENIFTKKILNLTNMTKNNTKLTCYTDKNLIDITGIQELKYLYYDIFNKDISKFDKMSENSRKQYEKDVREFYLAYTGKKSVPDNIKNFSDIQFNDCKLSYSTQPLKKDDSLIKNLAKNIKNMADFVNKHYEFLQNILTNIFIYNEKKDLFIINPKLDYKLLNKIINNTREVIVNLYVQTEKMYIENLKLLEAFIETKTQERDVQNFGFQPREGQELLKFPMKFGYNV